MHFVNVTDCFFGSFRLDFIRIKNVIFVSGSFTLQLPAHNKDGDWMQFSLRMSPLRREYQEEDSVNSLLQFPSQHGKY